ncbi:MAG TPA: hypothetical protein DCS67_00265 [Clostridiales bacterium UBA8960]|nr:hypothetical protein [Clostridiales bacterium UBA8960]
MAILVKHELTGVEYVMIGTGYSFYKDSIPSPLGGSFFPDVEEGEVKMVAVCDSVGTISWLSSDEVKVISIDGNCVSQLLEGRNDTYEKSEKCPACGYPVNARVEVCPSCELTLIFDED